MLRLPLMPFLATIIVYVCCESQSDTDDWWLSKALNGLLMRPSSRPSYVPGPYQRTTRIYIS